MVPLQTFTKQNLWSMMNACWILWWSLCVWKWCGLNRSCFFSLRDCCYYAVPPPPHLSAAINKSVENGNFMLLWNVRFYCWIALTLLVVVKHSKNNSGNFSFHFEIINSAQLSSPCRMLYTISKGFDTDQASQIIGMIPTILHNLNVNLGCRWNRLNMPILMASPRTFADLVPHSSWIVELCLLTFITKSL